MKRIRQSWDLIRISLTIIREHKKLVFLYLLSLLPLFVFISIIGIKIWRSDPMAGGFLEMLCFLYLMFYTWFMVIFFNVAFVHGVLTLLEGGRSFSIRESLKEALMRIGLIFKWIGFTVVLLLLLGCLKHWIPAVAAGVISNIFSLAWLCATYFIAPIMVFENLTASEALERSIRLLRKTWVELIVFGAATVAGVLLVAVSAAGLGSILIVCEKVCSNYWCLHNAVMPIPILCLINYLIPAVLGLLWVVLCIALLIFLGIMPLTYAPMLYSYVITGMSPREFQTKPEDKAND